nr:HAMP domain-containing sensor histidine kinase [uncultured Blautia sp.]
MIQNLRKKFILVAMFSTLVVLAAIMGVVNISNYKEVLDRADEMTTLLEKNGGKFPEEPKTDGEEVPQKPDGNTEGDMIGENNDQQVPPQKPENDREHFSVETPFETRYFTVTMDEKGEVTACDLDRIAAVDEDTAEEYAKNVSGKSGTTGFMGIYRYRVTKTGNGTKYVFLDCRREISNFQAVLITTVSVSGLGMAAVFVLVVIFSRMVFRPVEESIQKQKRFITDASHELKTPLTIIDANTEVMEMESGESQWTQSTRKQIQRLTGLVQQLVALSRLDEEKGLQDIAEFDLSEAVSESVQPYGALAQTKEKHLTLNIEGGLMYIGDEKSIRQLSGTLMDNAVKYSSEKGNIALTLKKKGKKILLEVYNDADGLPQGKLDVLFERFYRLDSSRNSGTGGSGIGLSVAQAIVQAHKGKITAENKTGNGLTITVLL